MAMLPEEIKRPLENLRDQVHRALDRWVLRRRRDDEIGGVESLARAAFSGLALEVAETDDAVIVYAELPGLRPGDFQIEATPDRLVLKGERAEEREERADGFHRLERRYGSFLRTIALPAEVQPEKAEARYRDGVLRVTLPKTEASKARRIPIRVRATNG